MLGHAHKIARKIDTIAALWEAEDQGRTEDAERYRRVLKRQAREILDEKKRHRGTATIGVIVSLAALVLALLFAGSAVASETADATEEWPLPKPSLVRKVERVAKRQFPNSPCAGKQKVLYNRDLAEFADGGTVPQGVGWQDGSCVMALAPLEDPLDFCTVYVHEYGHLAGFHHWDWSAGAGVMRQGKYQLELYRPCLEAAGQVLTLRQARAAARREARRMWHRLPRMKVRCDRHKVQVNQRWCWVIWKDGDYGFFVVHNKYGIKAL